MTPQHLSILKDNTHVLVGLDLSTRSSGFSLITGDTVYAETYNPSQGIDKEDALRDGKIRANLKDFMLEFINTHQPEYVILEDVFNGATPKIYRQLMNLNNIMDELILNGDINTELVRVNNRVWKTWLGSRVPAENLKYLTDKIKVETSLAYYGLTRLQVDHINGYQDEFDSIGMALGYYINNFLDSNCSFDIESVKGSNFNRSQLLQTLEVSTLPPSNIQNIKIIKDTTEFNRAVRKGILPFLRFSYDSLADSGEKCLCYPDTVLGILCEPLGIQPTLTPTDIYISYKR
jgi:Holliday junction resolvasome RuvABC endonuclease subunit